MNDKDKLYTGTEAEKKGRVKGICEQLFCEVEAKCRYVVVQLQPQSSLLRRSRKQCFTDKRQHNGFLNLHSHRNCCLARTQTDRRCPQAERLTER
jgi:hypothetical protein